MGTSGWLSLDKSQIDVESLLRKNMSKISRILSDTTPPLSWQEKTKYEQDSYNPKRVTRSASWFLALNIPAFLIMLALGLEIIQQKQIFYIIGLGLIVAALISSIIDGWLSGRERRFRLIQLLRKDGVMPGVCIKCNYGLKGCTSDRCPECGFEIGPLLPGEFG